MKIGRVVVACSLALGLGAVGWWATAQTRPIAAAITTVPGMPAVADPANLYSETVAGKLSPAVKGALPRVYVPNRRANTVSVIDPETMQVVDTFKVGRNPQHVVPSWDLKTLWVANNAEGRTDGSLTPIDPLTGKAGPAIPVDDPYNVYSSPDGKYAIIVAEELQAARLPQSADDEARIFDRDAALRRHQPRRLRDRRQLRALHLRVRRRRDQDRPGEPHRARHADLSPYYAPARRRGPAHRAREEEVAADHDAAGHRAGGARARRRDLHLARHAAGHPHLARRQDLLRGRHAGRRRACRGRRVVQADRLHPDRRRRARPLSQPRRQIALRREPRHQQDDRSARAARAASR